MRQAMFGMSLLLSIIIYLLLRILSILVEAPVYEYDPTLVVIIIVMFVVGKAGVWTADYKDKGK